MIRMLLAVCAWRLVRRIAAPAILIAVALLLLHNVSARQDRRHALGAVERVVRPVNHDLQQALRQVFGS